MDILREAHTGGATDLRLLKRVADSLVAAAASARRPTPAGIVGLSTAARRRRIELLDLSATEDLARWQILHNDHEHYAVISEKYSTVRGEGVVDYRCMITYDEIGEGLPLAKTPAELRAEDEPQPGDQPVFTVHD